MNNPDSTPLWLLMVFSAIAVYVYPRLYPRLKKFAAGYTPDDGKQSLFSLITLLALSALLVSLSLLIA